MGTDSKRLADRDVSSVIYRETIMQSVGIPLRSASAGRNGLRIFLLYDMNSYRWIRRIRCLLLFPHGPWSCSLSQAQCWDCSLLLEWLARVRSFRLAKSKVE